jgi:hypothetical protein
MREEKKINETLAYCSLFVNYEVIILRQSFEKIHEKQFGMIWF